MIRRAWPYAVLALIAASVGYQLFVDPIVGTADNNDWWRVIKQVGLDYATEPTMFANVYRDYVFVPKQDVAYLTSQLPLTRIALGLNAVFSSDDQFDLRWMGLVNAVAYLAAIGVFLAAFRRHKPWMQVTVAIAALVMFTDVRIVAYFNSCYCEPAQIIFLIAAIGFALLTMDETRTQRQRIVLYVLFHVTSILFFFAKTQDLVFCVPFAALAYQLLPTPHGWRPRAALAALVLALFVWGMKSDAYAATKGVNVRVHVEEELLKFSPTPVADLQVLGKGDVFKVTFGKIAVFYAKRPGRWWSMASRRMKEAFSWTPYGNFELPLRGESEAFDEFSNFKKRHYPRSLPFWIAAAVLYAGALIAKVRLGGERNPALLSGMLVVGCILQFLAVVTFEANGTEKHFFIFNVLVDLVLVLAIFELAQLASLVRARRLKS